MLRHAFQACSRLPIRGVDKHEAGADVVFVSSQVRKRTSRFEASNGLIHVTSIQVTRRIDCWRETASDYSYLGAVS